MSATFDLSLRFAEAPAPDLLDLWSGELHDIGSPLERAECTWRVGLPPDPEPAKQHLAAANEQLTGSLRRLPTVRDWLTGLGDGELSPAFGFDTDEARRTLWAWLDTGLAYADGSADLRLTRQKVENCRALVQRVRAACLPVADVETHIGDRLIGLSRLSLGGAVTTTVRSGQTGADVRLHERAVELAVSSRLVLLRILGLAARAAAAVSVRLALPGGPLLALGPLLKFVHDAVAGRQ